MLNTKESTCVSASRQAHPPVACAAATPWSCLRRSIHSFHPAHVVQSNLVPPPEGTSDQQQIKHLQGIIEELSHIPDKSIKGRLHIAITSLNETLEHYRTQAAGKAAPRSCTPATLNSGQAAAARSGTHPGPTASADVCMHAVGECSDGGDTLRQTDDEGAAPTRPASATEIDQGDPAFDTEDEGPNSGWGAVEMCDAGEMAYPATDCEGDTAEGSCGECDGQGRSQTDMWQHGAREHEAAEMAVVHASGVAPSAAPVSATAEATPPSPAAADSEAGRPSGTAPLSWGRCAGDAVSSPRERTEGTRSASAAVGAGTPVGDAEPATRAASAAPSPLEDPGRQSPAVVKEEHTDWDFTADADEYYSSGMPEEQPPNAHMDRSSPFLAARRGGSMDAAIDEPPHRRIDLMRRQAGIVSDDEDMRLSDDDDFCGGLMSPPPCGSASAPIPSASDPANDVAAARRGGDGEAAPRVAERPAHASSPAARATQEPTGQHGCAAGGTASAGGHVVPQAQGSSHFNDRHSVGGHGGKRGRAAGSGRPWQLPNAGSGGSSRTDSGLVGNAPGRVMADTDQAWLEAAPGPKETERNVEDPAGGAHAGEAPPAAQPDSSDDDLVVVSESIKRSKMADIHLGNVMKRKRRRA